MSTTLVEFPPTVPLTCPNCGVGITGHDAHDDPQHRIADLESQIRLLTNKATAAVDKLADYEDQLHRLKQSQPSSSSSPPPPATSSSQSTITPSSSTTTTPATTAPQRTHTPTLPNRLSNLLSPRSTSSTPPPPLPSPGGGSGGGAATADLQAALSREQNLRRKAEGQLTAASSELEELSAQLFTQANEMVAQERRARAKLEARVEVLEKRDSEKRARLEKLEAAVRRVERVRGLLGGGS